jgi:hypothetical protein
VDAEIALHLHRFGGLIPALEGGGYAQVETLVGLWLGGVVRRQRPAHGARKRGFGGPGCVVPAFGLCPWSAHAAAINKALYDVGLTVVMSIVFYWLLVRLPENKRRQRIKRSLEKHYRMFKEECIGSMLGVVEGSYAHETVKELIDQSRFRDYFKQQVSDSQNKGHVFLNRIDGAHFSEILLAMEMFRDEVLYTLNNTDIADDKSFEFLQRLSRAIRSVKGTGLGYESEESFFRLLWELFTGWNFVDGYPKEDVVQRMIRAI